ncbi:hypothetical protein EVAR_76860_1 [Eumeta japonica]|uniref:Uncharacterized protein n=1 Tax=Eumeta variegata TaxID=151549 RepID=A0A4C1SH98_EUMVA|nr:hypothetical protein EVAR_76860_1 [Eumeta japonica]
MVPRELMVESEGGQRSSATERRSPIEQTIALDTIGDVITNSTTKSGSGLCRSKSRYYGVPVRDQYNPCARERVEALLYSSRRGPRGRRVALAAVQSHFVRHPKRIRRRGRAPASACGPGRVNIDRVPSSRLSSDPTPDRGPDRYPFPILIPFLLLIMIRLTLDYNRGLIFRSESGFDLNG